MPRGRFHVQAARAGNRAMVPAVPRRLGETIEVRIERLLASADSAGSSHAVVGRPAEDLGRAPLRIGAVAARISIGALCPHRWHPSRPGSPVRPPDRRRVHPRRDRASRPAREPTPGLAPPGVEGLAGPASARNCATYWPRGGAAVRDIKAWSAGGGRAAVLRPRPLVLPHEIRPEIRPCGRQTCSSA